MADLVPLKDLSRFYENDNTSTFKAQPLSTSKSSTKKYSNYTVNELKSFAKKNGIDLGGAKLKADMVKLISDKAQKTKGIHEELSAKSAQLHEQLDNLRDLSLELNFPQIIVIGDESTGKSSLIERICMFPFFPRGNTSNQMSLCTQMPIHLKLKHLSDESCMAVAKENKLEIKEKCCWVRLKYSGSSTKTAHSPFFPVDEIESKVKSYMAEAVKFHNKGKSGVCDDILEIEVLSNDVPNLTLVDLPGIVHVGREEEPEGMPKITEAITRKYINQPHTLILAVARAYDSQRNSKALALVKECNKEKYALGVLTMCDLVSNKRLKKDLELRLESKAPDSIPLKHGYIAVRNRDTRTMEDNEQVQSLEDAAIEELEWFRENFPNLDGARCTTASLSSRLVNMMCNYIEETWVPETRLKITAQIQSLQTSISNLGEPEVEIKNSKSMKALFKSLCEILSKKLDLSFSFEKINCFVTTPICDPKNESWIQRRTRWPSLRDNIIGCILKGFEKFPAIVSSRCDGCLLDNSLPLKLSRFEVFRSSSKVAIESIIQEMLPKCINEFKTDASRIVTTFNSDSRLDNTSYPLSQIANHFALTLSTCAITHLIDCVILELPSKITSENLLKFAEPSELSVLLTDNTSKEREGLKQKREKLTQVLESICKLIES